MKQATLFWLFYYVLHGSALSNSFVYACYFGLCYSCCNTLQCSGPSSFKHIQILTNTSGTFMPKAWFVFLSHTNVLGSYSKHSSPSWLCFANSLHMLMLFPHHMVCVRFSLLFFRKLVDAEKPPPASRPERLMCAISLIAHIKEMRAMWDKSANLQLCTSITLNNLLSPTK